MALYSFCVRQKGKIKFERVSNKRYDLAFLDLLSMQFNSEAELLRFLGLNQSKYDRIAITYKNYHQDKILNVALSNNPMLENIASSMINFQAKCTTLLENLAIAYDDPSKVNVNKTVQVNAAFETIFSKMAQNRNPYYANKEGFLNNNAYHYYEDGMISAFKAEISKSYIFVRKMYDYLVKRGLISLKPNNKAQNFLSYMEIKNLQYIVVEDILIPCEEINKETTEQKLINQIRTLNCSSYIASLIRRIMTGDHDALEEFMMQDAETLQDYQDFLICLSNYLSEKNKENSQKIIKFDIN